MHTLHAQPAGIGGRYCGNAHHGAADRCVDLFCQSQNFRTGIVGNCTAADVDVRLFGSQNHFDCFFDLAVVDCRNRIFFHRLLCSVLIQGVLYVLGNVHQNRSRSAGLGNAECLPNGICQIFHTLYQEVVLGDRHGHAGDVHFLKAVPSDQRVRHVAGDRYQRHRVQICSGDTGDQIGGTRTGGGDDNADLAGGTCIAVCCMCGTLFMGCDDVMDPVLCQIEGIVDVDDLSARIAEYRRSTLFDQGFYDDLCTFQFHLFFTFLLGNFSVWAKAPIFEKNC